MNFVDTAFFGLPRGNQTLRSPQENQTQGFTPSEKPCIPYEEATRGLNDLIQKTATDVSTVSNQ